MQLWDGRGGLGRGHDRRQPPVPFQRCVGRARQSGKHRVKASHVVYGATKPFIGVIFAIFVVLVIRAKIIPLPTDDVIGTYYLLALSFVAGFSERFVSDLLTKIEGRATTNTLPPRER